MPAALVTGASTGIGRATALRLDAAGWRVFAGVRREADADSLRQEGSDRLTPVHLDVTEAGEVAAAAELIGAEQGDSGLDGLVNNAGVSLPSPLETMPIEDFRRQIEVNLSSQVAVTQAMLPALRGVPGRIVFISSIGGLIAFPMTGAYHAAKFGIEAVGDAFRRELRQAGISVSIVEPGSIATDIWDSGESAGDEIAARSPRAEDLYGESVERYRRAVKGVAGRGIPPDRVAKAIEHALSARRPRTRYLVGIDAKAQARLRHLIPARAFDRIIARATGF